VPDRVLLVGVVAVVRAHPVEAELLGEPDELVVEGGLLGQAVVLQLDVEAVSEELLVPPDVTLGPGDIARHDRLGDLGAQASREADQPLGVHREDLPVRAWPVVEALEPRLGRDLDEVVVAGVVGRQEGEVIGVGRVLALGRLLAPVAPEEVPLHPDDGLDSRLDARLVEIQGPIHHPVVGDGAGGHVVVGDRLEHLADTACPVEHGVLRMSVKMNETHSCSNLASGSDLFREPLTDPSCFLEPLEPVFSRTGSDPSIAPPLCELQRCKNTVGLAHRPRKPIRDFARTSATRPQRGACALGITRRRSCGLAGDFPA